MIMNKVYTYKKENGFTLVELLAVIVILAIIMIIAIPAVLNTLYNARVKTFEEFSIKSLNEAEKKSMQNQLLGNPTSSNCEIYSIKNDLDLSSTGDFDGYVLIKRDNNSVKKVVVLWNKEFMLLPYDFNDKVDYHGNSKDIIDSIENYDSSKSGLLTAETLCGYGCTSCSLNHEVIEVSCSLNANDVINFDYTGDEQEYTITCDGTYYIETWGAQGGDADKYHGGYGGYSSGSYKFSKGNKIYINVGGAGSMGVTETPNTGVDVAGGYNGGGDAYGAYCDWYGPRYSGSGGGATSISFMSGLIKSLENHKAKIIIVAGGGGGAHHAYVTRAYGNGANGGGYIGNISTWKNGEHEAYVQPVGGSQSSGGTPGYSWRADENNFSTSGSFGQGGNYNGKVCGEGSGGGGGFYGGGSGQFAPGAGGSGYIGNSNLTNGQMFCMDCEESTTPNTLTISTTGTSSLRNTTDCSSGFSNDVISKCAKSGNGYARLTYIGN